METPIQPQSAASRTARILRSAGFWITVIILARSLVHIIAINEYGYFVDEFYYIAGSARPDLGYVDHPPLSVWLLGIVRFFFGDSLLAIRMPMVFCGALLVWLGARLAKELGGSVFARIFAALAVAVVPVYLGMNKFYSMNSIDLCFWSGGMLLFLRAARTERDWDWLLLGIVLGLGLWNKHSILFFGFAIASGIVFTKKRRLLFSRGPYIAAVTAFAIFIPHIIWQIANDWPTIEFMQNARTHKNYFTPLHFLTGQILEIHPVLFPVWLVGCGALLFWKTLREYRIVGVWFVSLVFLFLATAAKTYYLAPAYPVLLAAGAIFIESLTETRRWIRYASVALVLVSGGALLPLSVPLLPPADYIKYQAALGIEPPRMEHRAGGAMPQHFADMFGWSEIQTAVAEAYNSIPVEQRRTTVILAQDYGYAGSIEFVRERYDLPEVGSGHNHYDLWGPPETANGEEVTTVIAAGFRIEDIGHFCGSIREGARAHCELCMHDRQESVIYVCEDLEVPFKDMWSSYRFYR